MAGDGANINYELTIPVSKIDKTRGILILITKEKAYDTSFEQYIIPLVPHTNANGSYSIGGNPGYIISDAGRLEDVNVSETTISGVECIVVSCKVDSAFVTPGADDPEPILWSQFDMPSAWVYD